MFFEIMNSNQYLNGVEEHVDGNKINDVLTAAKEMLSSDKEIVSVAEQFARDCALKEFLRISAYLTISRLNGILPKELNGKMKDAAKTFCETNVRNLQFWTNTTSALFTGYPIWDMESFEQLVIPYVKDDLEYVGIEEILSMYFTTTDNPFAEKWCVFLKNGLSVMTDADAKLLETAFCNL